MKFKTVVFLVIILITPNVEFARQVEATQDIKKELNRVADTFEKNVKPYLQKFASDQFNVDKTTIESKRLIDSYYKLYLQKAEQIRIDALKALFENDNPQQ